MYNDTVSDTLLISFVVSPFFTLPSFYAFLLLFASLPCLHCFFLLFLLLFLLNFSSLSCSFSSLVFAFPLFPYTTCFQYYCITFTMEHGMKARALLPLLHRLPCLQKRNNCPAFQSIQDRQRAPSPLLQQKDHTLSPLPLKEENSPYSETQAQDPSTSISVQKGPKDSNQRRRLFQSGT